MKELSRLAIPIQIDRVYIQNLLNQQFSDIIYKDDNPEHINILAKKYGEIIFKHECQKIILEIPLDLEISKKTMLVNFTSDAKLTLKISVKYNIRNDWKIVAETNIESYDWIESPNLGIGTISISVQKIGDYILNRSQHLISKSIDDAISKKSNLKTILEPKWQQLLEPRLIDVERAIWLVANVEKLAVYPIGIGSDKIDLGLSLDTALKVFIGEEPQNDKTQTLPDFQWEKPDENIIEVYLPIQLTEASLNVLVKDKAVGKTVEKQGYKIKIDNLDLRLESSFILVDMNYSGSVGGSISIKCIPRIDQEQQKIFFDDLKYDIKPKGFFAGLATSLFKKKISKMIDAKSVVELEEILTNLMNKLNAMLPKMLRNQFEINGEVKKLKLIKISIIDKVMIVDVESSGNGQLKIYVKE